MYCGALITDSEVDDCTRHSRHAEEAYHGAHRKPEVPIDTIERRLERLERDRCWKAMTTLAMGTLSLILLIGAGKSGETSAS